MSLSDYVRRSVVVNLKSGLAFTGALWSFEEPWLVLKGAQLIDGERRAPVDGEVIVHLAQIDFVQAMPEPVL